MVKLRELTKLCENEKEIFFFKKAHRVYFYRADKYGNKITHLQNISFEYLANNVTFSL